MARERFLKISLVLPKNGQSSASASKIAMGTGLTRHLTWTGTLGAKPPALGDFGVLTTKIIHFYACLDEILTKKLRNLFIIRLSLLKCSILARSKCQGWHRWLGGGEFLPAPMLKRQSRFYFLQQAKSCDLRWYLLKILIGNLTSSKIRIFRSKKRFCGFLVLDRRGHD